MVLSLMGYTSGQLNKCSTLAFSSILQVLKMPPIIYSPAYTGVHAHLMLFSSLIESGTKEKFILVILKLL